MKSAVAAAMFAASAAATTVGNGVPLIYAATPYPDSIYNGTQYNATVINGVTYNASNEWPHLNAAGYESIIPSCSVTCISASLAADDCDVDDFYCHCTAEQSAKIDAAVVPCLTSGPDALCTGEEIGQLANFVHGSLCPYFIDTTPDSGSSGGSYGGGSYGGGSWGSSSSSSVKTSSKTTSSKKTSTTSSSPSWPTWTTWSTGTSSTWETWCPDPTTFSVGTKTWTVTKATTITVTDCPITWSKPVTTWGPVTWSTSTGTTTTATGTWTTPAAAWPASSSGSWPAGAASGTASWSSPAAALFTGAASNNKVAQAMGAVAVGAAALLL